MDFRLGAKEVNTAVPTNSDCTNYCNDFHINTLINTSYYKLLHTETIKLCLAFLVTINFQARY